MLLKPNDAKTGGTATASPRMGTTATVASAGARGKGKGMRMTMATSSTMSSRIHRKGFRIPSKKHPGKALPGKLHSISRIGPGKIPPGKRIPQRPHPPSCDNSNDSGFGFDQHVELQQNNNNNNNNTTPQQHIIRTAPLVRSMTVFDHDDSLTDDSNDYHMASTPSPASNRCQARPKRRKVESVVAIDNDDACSQDAFVQKIATASALPVILPPTQQPPPPTQPQPVANTKYMSNGIRSNVRAGLKRQPAQQPNSVVTSSNGRVQLEIVSQPEQQHRARYQTEGSRGAVKDRSGNGFPIVRLSGYNKSTVLQVFIGTDIGRVAPHMFYQACKVAGKNSTPCSEKKLDGTMLIEIEFKPEHDMTVTCDCVGILKERNVDVEHRFPDHLAQKSKKKSTRCRMVFRTQLTHDDGSVETIQICSNPIICTQPPGVPEICKQSLNSSPVEGGLELFIIGKNFLKDTCVVFKEYIDGPQSTNDLVQMSSLWEQTVLPDKEYLQQTHLVCTVPPYIHQNLHKPITVELFVMSSGKKSESHSFVYTPTGSHTILSAATALSTLHGTITGQDSQFMDTTNGSPTAVAAHWGDSIEPKHELDSGMMPPPATTNIPIGVRRLSATSAMLTDQMAQLTCLKTEIIDESSSHSMAETMQTDVFPVVTANDALENAMEYERIRKQNMDLMDMRTTMSMMTDSNSIASFPTQHSIEMAVKNDQMAMLNAAAAVQQGQETVDKFLSCITESPQCEAAAAANSLFVQANGGATNVPIGMYPSDVHAATTIEQTISNMLSNSNPSQVPMEQILSLSQQQPDSSPVLMRSPSNCSSSSSSSSSSPPSHFDSPIPHHDIILNSNTAVNLLMSSSSPNSTTPLATDIILNSSVSPTLLCHPGPADPMMASQVAMANTLLNEMASSMPSQAAQEAILNNIILNTSNNPPANSATVGEPTAASTAVSNMIIKVAADFITSQEKNALETDTTMSAFMSLNANPMPTQAQVSQILNSQVTTTAACQPQTQMMVNHHPMLDTRPQDTLVNILMNHNAESAPTGHIGMGVTPISTQESLLQTTLTAAALATPQTVVQNVPQVQTAQPTSIPQELTIMSDQDLLSYINPSAFDQV